MFETPRNKALLGDASDLLKTLPPDHFHSCVTDPPYELTAGTSRKGFMDKAWDGTGIAHDVGFWKEVLRVMRPGAYLLAFGGTRTYHRLACAIEDAGFEVRGQMQWIYGSGFPKSLDMAKAIDKVAGAEGSYGAPKSERHASSIKTGRCQSEGSHDGYKRPWKEDPAAVERVARVYQPATPEAKKWKGWGTALKPAHEPICIARKPLSEPTVAANVMKWGTGALNIDDSRINGDRFPSDIFLDEETGEMLDHQSGELTSGANPTRRGADKFRNIFGDFEGQKECKAMRGADSGGASRFFYCAKASAEERGWGNTHPTVKPVKLIQYLVRLVTPPGGVILDPFLGSGTTAVACRGLGVDWVGIEKDAEHMKIIQERLGRDLL